MTRPEIVQQPKARASAAGVAVPLVLVVSSTAFAIALHHRSPAPGDQPFTLLLVGCVAAFVVGATRIARSLHVGLAALAGFPLEAMLDLVRNGGHNLLPVEFAFYAVYMALGVAAAVLGRVVGRVMRVSS